MGGCFSTGFAPPPPLFPPGDHALFSTPMSIKILVMYDIYSSCLTNALSSLRKDNQRHQTTLMGRRAHHRTNPTAHLDDDLLVVIVRLMHFQTCDAYLRDLV
jgi:hypothetical protein